MTFRATIFLLLSGSFSFTKAQTLFTEVGLQKGLTYIYPGNDNQEVGAGVTVLDVNNDGWDDFFQSGGVFASKLWVNMKGTFINQTEEYFGKYLDTMFIQASAAGDFNNDGYTDLFICNYGEGLRMGDKKPSLLLQNFKGKSFKPVFTGTFKEIGHFSSVAWGDLNLDGYIDLYVTNYVKRMNKHTNAEGKEIGYDPTCLENRFYLNLGGKGFAESSARYHLDDDGCGLAACFTDIDRDGDLDIFLMNDFGSWNHKGNQLFRNEYPADSLTNISKPSGTYREIYGMGIGPGDYDNDGDMDYYVTNIGENFLFNNTGEGKFEDRGRAAGVNDIFVKDTLRGTGWSGIFFDLENDGDLDLYVSKGNVKTLTPKTAISDPNRFYLNEGPDRFKEIGAEAGVDDILSHRGAAVLDYDHDGDLDLISSVIKMHWGDFGGLDQRIKLFQNDAPFKGNWIGLCLSGGGKVNRNALGSMVEIESNGSKQIREVDGGSGHSSQSTSILYFGLGDSALVAQATIFWMGGGETVLNNLEAGKVYSVNIQGKVKVLY